MPLVDSIANRLADQMDRDTIKLQVIFGKQFFYAVIIGLIRSPDIQMVG
jgi:hypothetical protein